MPRGRRFTYVDFTKGQESGPVMAAANALSTGADATVGFFHIGDDYFEIRYEAPASTVADVCGTRIAAGWQVPNDNTDNEGIEITQGILASGTNMSFVVGTDSFALEVKFKVPDVSDYDLCWIGFRTLAAYVDAINAPATLYASYTEMVGFNVNAGALYSHARKGGATTGSVDSTLTWADNATKTLRAAVASTGAVTWSLDGTNLSAAQLGANSGFSLTAAQVVVPSLIFVKGAAASDTPPVLATYGCGL